MAAAARLASLTASPVESVDELPGRYYRPFALPGQIRTVHLGELRQGEGDYSMLRSCGLPSCWPETGVYHAVPENPAIGFAFIGFSTPAAQVPDMYIIERLWRDASGDLAALQLRRMLPANLTGLPFLMYRVDGTGSPDDDDDVADATHADDDADDDAAHAGDDAVLELARSLRPDELAATTEAVATADAAASASCATYRALADYYLIRALQCAYSICYPLSSWYGYWAEYYTRLVEQTCDESEG